MNPCSQSNANRFFRTTTSILNKWGWMVLLCLLPIRLVAQPVNPEQVTPDWALTLEKAIFHEEIKGDIAAASILYTDIHRNPTVPGPVAVEALCRDIICHLVLHSEKEAHALFKTLQTSFPGEEEWIQYISQHVPDSFLRKPVLWEDHASDQYEWRQTSDNSWAGHSAIETRRIPDGDTSCWRLSVRSIHPDGYRIIRVDFDPVTLEPVYSQTRTRAWLPFEKALIPQLSSDNLTAYPGDTETIGFLIRHYPLSLGQQIDTDLFDPSEGVSTRENLEVPSLEMVDTAGAGRIAAFRVDVLNAKTPRRFWIEQAGPFRLIQAEDGYIRGRLHAQRNIQSDTWIQTECGPIVVEHPSSWVAATGPDKEDDGQPPVILMVPDLKARVWIISPSDLPRSGNTGVPESIKQLIV
ncbi:MAG: hypothetical protein JW706_01740, partial [Opitutales bacterium]|nr:hypothetical protein [Opitutales bacterium]